MAQPAIVFDGVWKKFRRGERHDSLRDLIPAAIGKVFGPRVPAPELEAREFWAVHDVSFEVKPGEALGIIGPNGAGKSTILKLLSRILRPTRGLCQVTGRAGALIEVAAGFHPDLTGRENVFLQGAIMGMKRTEIGRKFDEIVEFAGVSEFIDTPVKRYSSGMNARLGFAIAAHLDPDVLLIDEVLSVGDAVFQDKCVERMRVLIKRGVPVVFISHNLPAILDLCTRAIVIDHGTVHFDGAPAAAIQEYRLVPWRTAGTLAPTSDQPVRLARTELLNDHAESAAVFHTNGRMRIRIHYETHKPMPGLAFAVDIHRADGVYCAGINTLMDRVTFDIREGKGSVDLSMPRLSLLPGHYLTSIGILDGASGASLDVHSRAYPFSVMSDRRDFGVVYLDHDWTHRGGQATSEAATPAPAPRAHVVETLTAAAVTTGARSAVTVPAAALVGKEQHR
jgi:lipopolysaccharide transport system ATP-binding protein